MFQEEAFAMFECIPNGICESYRLSGPRLKKAKIQTDSHLALQYDPGNLYMEKLEFYSIPLVVLLYSKIAIQTFHSMYIVNG